MAHSDEEKVGEVEGENVSEVERDGSGEPAATLQVERGNHVDISPPRGHEFLIVGVGASAGGLDAFKRLLEALPESTGMAFVLIQHLDPSHESQLPALLATSTAMPVCTAEDGMAVQRNQVYVIPPNSTLTLDDGSLHLAQRKPGLHLPIDAFFESLSRAQGGRAIAIVLSGNASDGSQGVRAIKQECGITFAQSEATAQHVGMPRNAIATGAIDYVLSPEEIARELIHLSRHPFVRPPEPSAAKQEVLPGGDGEIRKVFVLLRNSTKVDFSHYKQNTVRRRIGRRMIVRRSRNLAEYVKLLEESPEEVRELYRDLLISVTSFFRDPDVFESLSRILKDTLASREATEPFRVWVPGCATGEELYSLAICIKELLDELQLVTPVQFFGTDISEIALDRARAGTFPDIIAQDVSAERLRRFFVRVDRGYQVSKLIRESCVFARQDVANDPPFGHTDLISCRNLLIYVDAALQNKILPIFHYSLNPTGILVLGSAESLASASDLFTVIDKQHRIYGRKAAPLRHTLHRAAGAITNMQDNVAPGRTRTPMSSLDLQKKADLVIQSKYAPPAVVVDEALRIVLFRGRTGFYLEAPPGEADLNLLRMARERLALPLRRTIEAAASRNISTQETGIGVEYRGERREVNVEVTPIAGPAAGERYFLVVFEDAMTANNPLPTAVPHPPETDSFNDVAVLESRVSDLQQQLAEVRENLRNVNEDHEASSEELRAANEEIRSANEELQSTNEELSTTKEELQSTNEELTTLNEELQNRNRDLDTANNDLVNLLKAVNIPFLMVDNELRLRKFSAAAEEVLNVGAVDIGHSLTTLDGPLDLGAFDALIRRVIESLHVEHWDLQNKQGNWFSATVRPYRTVDNRIDGAVLVFVDIDPLKQALRAAEQARDYAEGMIETVREPLLVLEGDLRIQRATPAFYDTFRVSRSETEGRLFYDLGNGQWNVPRLRQLIGDALFRGDGFQDFEIEHEFPYIGRRTMRLNARRISRDGDDHRAVLLAIEDVTERREHAEIRYQRLFETAKDAMLIFDAETEQLTDVNPYFIELTGYGREKLIGRRLAEMEVFTLAGKSLGIVGEARTREVMRYDEVVLVTTEGVKIEAELLANRYTVGSQSIVQVNARDVTKRNRAIKALRESEERFRLLVDNVRDYALFQTDITSRIVSWSSGAERLLGYSEAEILGHSAIQLFTPEDIARGEAERELEVARSTGKAEDERWHLRKDGSRFFASGVLTTVRDEAGQLRGFAKVMRDITARNRAEEQLKQQAQLLELAQDVILVRRLDGTITFWNDAARTAFGWSKEEALGKNSHELLKTSPSEPLATIEARLLAETRWEGELVYTRRDGCQLTVWSRWALQFDSEGKPAFVLEINSDITARKVSEQRLRSSLREKEVLLKEIHHRVKNNLQVIASLLSLQTDYIGEPKALAMLEDMKSRVRSIAAIHEMLYSSADLSRIDFAGYLDSITKDLMSFYSAQSGRTRLTIDAEPIVLDITQAVPCGLIVNELLTNSLKYAFPENVAGTIEVSFRCDDGKCTLRVSDNGIGLPDGLDPENASSMGLQLVILLVQQLGAKLMVIRGSGVSFVIEFGSKLIGREDTTDRGEHVN